MNQPFKVWAWLTVPVVIAPVVVSTQMPHRYTDVKVLSSGARCGLGNRTPRSGFFRRLAAISSFERDLGLEVRFYRLLFGQRPQIGDNVLPVFLVRHEVDHPRSLDEFAGPLEIFVEGLFVPSDVGPLHCRRIVIAGLCPALAAERTGQ